MGQFLNFNVVGDIAGNFLTLKALLDQMPKDAELISLGDPNDRGPRSKEVIEFLMTNGQTVQSNHAHMFTERFRQSENPHKSMYYDRETFFWNGGGQTLNSYGIDWNWKTLHTHVPKEHIEWLESCPMYIKTDKYFFSHAPLHVYVTIEKASQLGTGFYSEPDPSSDYSLLWNRDVPERPHKELEGRINIFGHNSSDMVKVYTTQFPKGIKVDNTSFQEILERQDKYPIYGICIDTSSNKVLTGLHIPSMTLYQQKYIDGVIE